MRGWHDARLAFLISLRSALRPLNETSSPIQSTPRKGAQRSSPSCAPFPSWGVPTRGKALVATQGALAAPLQRIDLEWLLTRSAPSVRLTQAVLNCEIRRAVVPR